MNGEILAVLKAVESGSLTAEQAAHRLKLQPFEDLGFAKIDHHRAIRQGASEVIYGAGKTPEQIAQIAAHMLANGRSGVLITRLAPEAAEFVARQVPLDYHADARVGVAGVMPPVTGGRVVIATGGTSDIPVAEEAALTVEFHGCRAERLYDVGVSGIHRLLSALDELADADAIVAAAGMEGALASVIGGLADCPVIAVPTSVGYGASFGGVAALLAMLNSCASGVSVVNIDNGFGAGYLAAMIAHIADRPRADDGEDKE